MTPAADNASRLLPVPVRVSHSTTCRGAAAATLSGQPAGAFSCSDRRAQRRASATPGNTSTDRHGGEGHFPTEDIAPTHTTTVRISRWSVSSSTAPRSQPRGGSRRPGCPQERPGRIAPGRLTCGHGCHRPGRGKQQTSLLGTQPSRARTRPLVLPESWPPKGWLHRHHPRSRVLGEGRGS
jgi:hypothetical protein